MKEVTRANMVGASWWLIALSVIAMLAAIITASARAQSSGPVNTPLLNKAWYFVGTSPYATTIQSAVTAACASSPGGAIVIPAGVAPGDTIGAVTGGCTKTWILDQRQVTEACYSWSGSAYTATACATGTLTPGGGNFAIQYADGSTLAGANFIGLVMNNGSSGSPSQASAANVASIGTLSNATTGNAATATSLSGALAANQVLGSLTATAPSGLSVPSCSGTTQGLIWTTGVGYGCNTYSFSSGLTVGTTTIGGGTSGRVEYNNGGVLGERIVTGTGTEIVSSTTGTRTNLDLASWNSAGDAIDSGVAINNLALLGASTQTFSGNAIWNGIVTVNSILYAQLAECTTCVVEALGQATSGTNFNSGNTNILGTYFNGSTLVDTWNIQSVLGSGTNPTTTLTFSHASGSTGFASISFPAINATSIGAQTAGTGAFTGLNATSIGAATPGTGAFTTLAGTHISATGAITQTAYFQIATGTGCSVTAVPFNACATTMTLPVTEPDTSYIVSGCMVNGANQFIGNIGSFTTSNFVAATFSEGQVASGGAVACLVTHP